MLTEGTHFLWHGCCFSPSLTCSGFQVQVPQSYCRSPGFLHSCLFSRQAQAVSARMPSTARSTNGTAISPQHQRGQGISRGRGAGPYPPHPAKQRSQAPCWDSHRPARRAQAQVQDCTYPASEPNIRERPPGDSEEAGSNERATQHQRHRPSKTVGTCDGASSCQTCAIQKAVPSAHPSTVPTLLKNQKVGDADLMFKPQNYNRCKRAGPAPCC